MQNSSFVLFLAICNYASLNDLTHEDQAIAMQDRKGTHQARRTGGKRLNLVQARLNDNEREKLDGLRRRTGLTDSALVRAALNGLAHRIEAADGGEALQVA